MTKIENAQITSLNNKMDKVLSLLEDSSTSNQKGLVSRMNDIERSVGRIKTDEKVKRGKVTALTIVGSGIVTFLGWLFK